MNLPGSPFAHCVHGLSVDEGAGSGSGCLTSHVWLQVGVSNLGGWVQWAGGAYLGPPSSVLSYFLLLAEFALPCWLEHSWWAQVALEIPTHIPKEGRGLVS